MNIINLPKISDLRSGWLVNIDLHCLNEVPTANVIIHEGEDGYEGRIQVSHAFILLLVLEGAHLELLHHLQ